MNRTSSNLGRTLSSRRSLRLLLWILDILLRFETTAALRPTFALFDPLPCKNKGSGGQGCWISESSSVCPKLWYTFDWRYLRFAEIPRLEVQ